MYSTVIVMMGLTAVVIADVARLIARIIRLPERDLERLIVQGSDALARELENVPRPKNYVERVALLLSTAKAQRQKQLEYLRSLLDTVSAALVVVGSDGRVDLVNRAARRLATRQVSRIEEIVTISDSVAARLLELRPGTSEILSMAGGQRLFASVSRFSDADREPLRLISLQRITGELDAVELTAWKDMAHVLAHEMMNSLTPICSLSEGLEVLIKRDGHKAGTAARLNDEILRALEVITRRSNGLMDFVERYRAVSELPEPRLQSTALEPLLDGIGRLLKPALTERNIGFCSAVSPADLCFPADPQLLEQAVINLLRNAIDAVSAATQPKIQVSCFVLDELVHIEVSDNGVGVTGAAREQIFVPFFTTKAGGSGIGLTLVRQIALGHGGRLEVRENHPSGSIFTLLLPADRPQHVYQMPQRREVSGLTSGAKSQ